MTEYLVKADDEILSRHKDASDALIVAEICRRDEEERGTGRKIMIAEKQESRPQ